MTRTPAGLRPALLLAALAVFGPGWISTDADEGGLVVTPDGRFIFFPRENRDNAGSMALYWVDARILDGLRGTAPGE